MADLSQQGNELEVNQVEQLAPPAAAIPQPNLPPADNALIQLLVQQQQLAREQADQQRQQAEQQRQQSERQLDLFREQMQMQKAESDRREAQQKGESDRREAQQKGESDRREQLLLEQMKALSPEAGGRVENQPHFDHLLAGDFPKFGGNGSKSVTFESWLTQFENVIGELPDAAKKSWLYTKLEGTALDNYYGMPGGRDASYAEQVDYLQNKFRDKRSLTLKLVEALMNFRQTKGNRTFENFAENARRIVSTAGTAEQFAEKFNRDTFCAAFIYQNMSADLRARCDKDWLDLDLSEFIKKVAAVERELSLKVDRNTYTPATGARREPDRPNNWSGPTQWQGPNGRYPIGHQNQPPQRPNGGTNFQANRPTGQHSRPGNNVAPVTAQPVCGHGSDEHSAGTYPQAQPDAAQGEVMQAYARSVRCYEEPRPAMSSNSRHFQHSQVTPATQQGQGNDWTLVQSRRDRRGQRSASYEGRRQQHNTQPKAPYPIKRSSSDAPQRKGTGLMDLRYHKIPPDFLTVIRDAPHTQHLTITAGQARFLSKNLYKGPPHRKSADPDEQQDSASEYDSDNDFNLETGYG